MTASPRSTGGAALMATAALLSACASSPMPPMSPASAPSTAAPAPASAAAMPAAPTLAATVAQADPKVLGVWRIEQARSEPLLDKRETRVNFGSDGVVSGNASCNTFSARYTLVGNQLKIGALATTRKSCTAALLEQEDRVLTALERASRAAVPPHGFLTLQDADGAVLMRASRYVAPEGK